MNATGPLSPGIEFGSRAFFDACLTDCPEPLRPAVECLARRWGNDHTDPNAMARIILNETRKAMRGVIHHLRSGAAVKPSSVSIHQHSVSYTGLDAQGNLYVYVTDDINSSEPV